jgi:molybdopterin-synthase adenylyltransferase
MSKRYERNRSTISEEDNRQLAGVKVLVAGCGGLGGFVIEELGRLGVGIITAVDGDVFEESNLNRQLLSTMQTLGRSKALAAKERMAEVNPEITVLPVQSMITEENARELLGGHDLVIDALDNAPSRFILEKFCEELAIPMVHGAIAGWFGHVSVIFPGDRTMEKLYSADSAKGAETELGNPSFTPALVASIEAAEAVKVLLKRGETLRNRLLTIDLLNQEYEVFEL